ncbi:MAG: hypothetical protein A2151_06430 [Candidatus Muproteobacteria bacterium RBG_16_65_34]|uniref:PEGA domain-containing protein n=1 Tax=Candidatus Muproteobacteria bacterium RBG_16_65_34 TaxID=1817760 RepID=A0A1F6TQW1_9PROT|nr:MAG: hypothetical protein A2151_06430 [Candidatus Muproteobacteria bacterium RBG_16_65_34]
MPITNAYRLPALLALAAVSACVPLPPEPGFISVESEPAGADVVVMGKNLGRTPLRIRQEDVFPVTYPPEKLAQYGTIVLKKEGCRDYVQSVDNKVYVRGLKARLDCGARPSALPGGQTGGSTESAEERLRRLKELREKGLITEEEEKAARRRILNEL